MANSNNQTNDIYSISGVEDLSCDTAANIQGGAAMTLYKNHPGDRNPFIGPQKILAKFNYGGVDVMSSGSRNQASYVSISTGVWEFSSQFQHQGKNITLGRGNHDFSDYGLNDDISSFRRVG